jgi:hypothetical protein
MAVSSEQLLEPSLLELRMCRSCLRLARLSILISAKIKAFAVTNACAVGNSPIRRRPTSSPKVLEPIGRPPHRHKSCTGE